MKLLSIDSSTRKYSIALSENDKVLSYKNFSLNRLLSTSIMPSITQILNKAKISFKQLDGYVVGLGPGSFTSLRVGLASIKGLIFACPKPVVGISSLDVIAMNVKEDNQSICVIVDARRSLVYSCLYAKQNGSLVKKGKRVLTDIETVLDGLKGDVIFIGDGISLYRENIESKSGLNPIFTSDKLWGPKAQQLMLLGLERFKNKQYDDINSLVPLYLYPEDCQVSKKI